MEEITFDYDKKNDVMYVNFAKAKDALAEEVSSNVLIRYEPKTRKIVGITIMGFSEFLKEKKAIKVPLSV